MKTTYWSRLSLFSAAALFVAAAAPAFAQGSGQPLIQPGQIVGGATKEMRDVQPLAGFLPQPSLLAPGAAGQVALVYRNPSVNFASYGKVMLDPVTIWTSPGSALDNVPPDQRRDLANGFYWKLYDAVAQHCQMTRTVAPGTILFRFALTDAKTPNAGLNTVATYAPYASTAYSVASVLFNKGVGYFAGSASAQGYAVDATTGALLWEGVDKRGGTTALVENTLNTWLDVEHAFDDWSKQLAAGLQGLGVCRS
jgi:hypothetical protein